MAETRPKTALLRDALALRRPRQIMTRIARSAPTRRPGKKPATTAVAENLEAAG